MENDKKNFAKEFVTNSIKILIIKENQENNVRTVLEFYQKISSMLGPESDMIKIFDGIESVKILITENSIDPIYNFHVIRKIENNFEKYFSETRYPSEKEEKSFHKYLREKNTLMKKEIELMQDFQKQTT